MPISMDYEPAREPYRSPADGAWVVTRYADAVRVLRSSSIEVPSGRSDIVARVSQRLGGRLEDLAALVGHLPILQNPPDHAPARAFLSEIIRGMMTDRDRRTDEVTERLLDSAAAEGDVDVIPGLCYRLPDTLIGEAIGFSPAELRDLRAAGNQVIEDWRPAMPLRDYEVRQALSADIRRQIADRWGTHGCPVHHGPSRIGGVGTAISEQSRDGSLVLLIVLTIDSMAGFLGNTLYLLAERPDLQNLLRRKPDRMAAFVEEALRYCGPIRQRSRVVRGEIELGGAMLPDGTLIHVKLESASRDPEAYPEPESFDIDRKGPPVLAFGAGPHVCAGAAFARGMAKRFLALLLSRFALHPGREPPRLSEHPEIRQFVSLPLRLEAI